MRRFVVGFALLAAATLPACTNDTPPPGALMAQAAFPKIGTSWVMHVTNSTTAKSGDQRVGAQRVEQQGFGDARATAVSATYHDAPAYGIQSGNYLDILNPETFNYMAQFSNGTETSTNSPDDGRFSWPLWVGKSWSVTIKAEFPNGGPVPGIWGIYRKVTAYEDVTVPAGTYKAFRIDSFPGQGVDPGFSMTLWYAPSVACTVKTVLSLSSKADAGQKTITTEMVLPPRP